MSENTEQNEQNESNSSEDETNKKNPNIYISIVVASVIIASPFIIYNYFFKSSPKTELPITNNNM